MLNWRLAQCLIRLREQINEAFPARDRRSDGSIGNAEHAARKSDHNPWVKDSHGIGVVTAIDVDRELGGQADGASGLTVQSLVEALQASKDPRIKYLIWNGLITTKGDITKWKPYHGANAHKHHVHISVSSDPSLYDNARDWNISAPHQGNGSTQPSTASVNTTKPSITTTAGPTYKVKQGDTLSRIASITQVSQLRLVALNKLTNPDRLMVGQILKLGE